ncbi:MAG: hypothetical protein IJ629_02745 [Clostridia bacterium]|nr:hypothetical protein [Clostridia bacterium]
MVGAQYEIAMAETLYYLKGIRKEDLDKIPKKMMHFLQENASKEYQCNFDYTKPLNELNLRQETKGIIGCICLNCWCETEEQKAHFLKNLKKNEREFQEQLSQKYPTENIFEESMTDEMMSEKIISQTEMEKASESIIIKKESFWGKIKKWFKSLYK